VTQLFYVTAGDDDHINSLHAGDECINRPTR